MSSDLICPASGGPLREVDGALLSDRGIVYPIVAGVAVIVQGVRIEPRTTPLDARVIDQLSDALVLPSSRRESIEQAFSHHFTFTEDWIQTEADQFLYRVAASHEGLRAALEFEAEDKSLALHKHAEPNPDPVPLLTLARLRRMLGLSRRISAPSVKDEVEHRLKLTSTFKLAKLRPRTRVSVNVRLENVGRLTLLADGPQPIRLSYDWIDAQGVRAEGRRTELLDDILPGRAMTMPVLINTPQTAGRYTLSIRALQEDVRWFDDAPVDFDVEIGWGAATTDTPRWPKTRRLFDYMADHYEGVRLLALWRDTLFSRTVERVVELGGNAEPMIDHLDAPQKYNVDIDPYGMIVGNLVRSGGASTVKFIVADGMALPMRPRSIDMLVLFATFHHFPDPIGLLSRLSHFVADDGLICLMCEPIGHVRHDTMPEEYRTEIRRGVNEQSFALWEYRQMFDAARLDVVVAQIDIGSAKFALRPRR